MTQDDFTYRQPYKGIPINEIRIHNKIHLQIQNNSYYISGSKKSDSVGV